MPILTADVMMTAAIPHVQITDRGYVRLRDGVTSGLFDTCASMEVDRPEEVAR